MSNQMRCDRFEEEIFGKVTFRRFRVNGKSIFTATAEDGRYMKFSFRQLRSRSTMNLKFLQFMWDLIPHVRSDYSRLVDDIIEHSIVDASQSPPKGWSRPPSYVPL